MINAKNKLAKILVQDNKNSLGGFGEPTPYEKYP